MSYSNPLHGLDGNGEKDWASEIGEQQKVDPYDRHDSGLPIRPVDPPTIELDPGQSRRMLALQLAANTLKNSSGEWIIEAAKWIIGDETEIPTSAADRIANKVNERNAKMQDLFSAIISKVEAVEKATEVDPDDLHVGDVIAPDGDILISEPVLEGGFWRAEAHCPSTAPEDSFTFDWPAVGDKVRVYNR